jgi:inhibitor of KinA
MNSYSIFPLGDSAITIDLGNCIDEQFNIKTIAIQDWLQARPFPGRFDVIAAYSSVTVFYDPAEAFLAGVGGSKGIYAWLEGLLRQAWEETAFARAGTSDAPGGGPERLIEIPVCYEGEYAPDLPSVAAQKGVSPEEVVGLHTSAAYRVYMIGFLPGFPYLGRLDDRLGISRKQRPEAVRAGGVGIAGMQTGIYPLNSPGGWWIIGRTPVRLFDAGSDPPVLLRSGDQVRFRAISAAEFKRLSIC